MTTVTEETEVKEHTQGMKRAKTIMHPLRSYGDAAFSVAMFPLVVGLLYRLTRIVCAAAFKAILGQ